MKIHEYQGKEILRQFGVPTPLGTACFSVDEAVAAAQQLGGALWVVKAQIHAGGRGKGRVILRAKRDALLGLPKMWRKRREIQKNRVATVGQIWRALDKRVFGW